MGIDWHKHLVVAGIIKMWEQTDPDFAFAHVIQGGGGTPGTSPPKIGKNMIFWRKIVIFHTKYSKNFRASLPFFLVHPPNLKSWIHPLSDMILK